MKKLLFVMILVLALVFVFSSCAVRDVDDSDDQRNTTDTTDSTVPGLSEEDQTIIVEDFTQSLDDGIDEDVALDKMRNIMPDLSKDNNTEMLLAFEEYQKQNLAEEKVLSQGIINLLTQSGIFNENELNDPEQIADAELKSSIEELQARGYLLRFSAGLYWAEIDYSVYLDLSEFANEDIAAYLHFMSNESQKPFADDAGLIIPINDVYDRARMSEDFISDYPNSVKYDMIHEYYQRYVSIYFYGTDNTPAFEFTTQKLKDDFNDSYIKSKEDEQISILADMTADYLVILEANSHTLTDEVTQYRNDMVETLLDN